MKIFGGVFLCICSAVGLSHLQTSIPKREATTIPLDCSSGDCPLLKGTPQTAGLRSGFVRLKPGEAVGWHTTGTNEETLIILHGRGDAMIGLFVLSWIVSIALYKWRRFDEIEKLAQLSG